MVLTKSIETGQVNSSAADIYEAFFVPALFRRWAVPVTDAADIKSGQQVLDVACGTGVLTREIARRISTSGKVIGLDINDEMLTVARRKAPHIEWRHGEAEALPFSENRFDAVVSQFGLMFFRDRERAVSEMVRVLKPGQRLVVAVWDKLENTPGYAAAAALLHRLFGETIAESLRSPFVLGDKSKLRVLFDDKGLSEISADTLDDIAEFPSIEDWIYTDVRGWTLADVLDDNQYALLLREAKIALREFMLSDGRVIFPSPAHIVKATKS